MVSCHSNSPTEDIIARAITSDTRVLRAFAGSHSRDSVRLSLGRLDWFSGRELLNNLSAGIVLTRLVLSRVILR